MYFIYSWFPPVVGWGFEVFYPRTPITKLLADLVGLVLSHRLEPFLYDCLIDVLSRFRQFFIYITATAYVFDVFHYWAWALKCFVQGHSHERLNGSVGLLPGPQDCQSHALPLSHLGPLLLVESSARSRHWLYISDFDQLLIEFRYVLIVHDVFRGCSSISTHYDNPVTSVLRGFKFLC